MNAPLRTCKVCQETKLFEHGTWVWTKRKGCIGTVCLACANKKACEYAKANKAAHSAKSLRSAKNNPVRTKRIHSTWRKNNTAKLIAKNNMHKACKLQRCPKWVDDEQLWLIQEVYALAKLRTKLTGIQWHVDHVVPLRGKLVSGLHVLENLRVIPAAMNLFKGNVYQI